jgi:hypothetical protein
MKKALTGAERVRRNKQRNQSAGLLHIKIWVHPDEAGAVRSYAAKKPLTKAARKRLMT